MIRSSWTISLQDEMSLIISISRDDPSVVFTDGKQFVAERIAGNNHKLVDYKFGDPKIYVEYNSASLLRN